MGTWGTNIKDNDTFQDTYNEFFNKYNAGENPEDIAKVIIGESDNVIYDMDTGTHFWFAIALAQWETKCLEPKIYKKVKQIIDKGIDLQLWEGDAQMIKKRQKALLAFLAKISSVKEKIKKRVKPKELDYYSNDIINLDAPDNSKTFILSESGTSKGHNCTGGYITFKGGGGSILYYEVPNTNVKAKWIDSHNLIIAHDKDIIFSKQDVEAWYCGDGVKIHYMPQ
jgi:hypothetical protein